MDGLGSWAGLILITSTRSACGSEASIGPGCAIPRFVSPVRSSPICNEVFFATWAQQHGSALPSRNWFPTLAPTDDETVRILASQPGDDKQLYYVWLLHALHAARRSISLSTGYFVPTHQERKELAHAARRGVNVRLVLPSQSDSD